MNKISKELKRRLDLLELTGAKDTESGKYQYNDNKDFKDFVDKVEKEIGLVFTRMVDIMAKDENEVGHIRFHEKLLKQRIFRDEKE